MTTYTIVPMAKDSFAVEKCDRNVLVASAENFRTIDEANAWIVADRQREQQPEASKPVPAATLTGGRSAAA